jgi:hypothetical protein
MARIKKVATNIPEDLLREATTLTGLNQTQALIAGLRELIAEHRRQELLDLEGKVEVDFDLKRSRQRRRV